MVANDDIGSQPDDKSCRVAVGQAAAIVGASTPARITIVIPVYNDWDSFEKLLDGIDGALRPGGTRCHVVSVNDASTQAVDIAFDRKRFEQIEQVDIVDLACNLGHQRAIAVGLAIVYQSTSNGTIVMDADGEDRPEDIPRLLAAAATYPGEIVCAKRTKRSESAVFVAFYAVYKAAFRCLAGGRIDFGNYCFIPRVALHNIVHDPMIWNHLAASIVKSRIPLRRVETARGRRYGGRSGMNFHALVLHGLSAIAVYTDIVLVRIVTSALVLAAVTLVGIIVVVALRLLTELAIPGWATNAAGLLLILLIQLVFTATISAFLLLAARSGPPFLPVRDALRYVIACKPKITHGAPGLMA